MRINTNLNRAMAAVVLTLVPGCSLWRSPARTTKLNTGMSERSMLEMTEQKDRKRDATALFLHQDSAKHRYELLIWPKGKFSFSADSGFSGEAAQVMLSGSRQDFGWSAGATELKEVDKGKLTLAQEKHNKSDVQRQTVATAAGSGWKWLLAGMLCMGLFGVWLYWKTKN